MTQEDEGVRSQSPLSEHEDCTGSRKGKRGRDAAYGPATPKGEGDEVNVLGGLTPLAKKGRVQPDPLATVRVVDDTTSDTDSQAADETATGAPRPRTPPGLDLHSAPPTPVLTGQALSHKTEGRETRYIRRRVQALEWEDGHPLTPSTESADVDLTSQVAHQQPTHDVKVADTTTRRVSSKSGTHAVDYDTKFIHQMADRKQEKPKTDISTDSDQTNHTLVTQSGAGHPQDVDVANVATKVGHSVSKVDEDVVVKDSSQVAVTDPVTVVNKKGDAQRSEAAMKDVKSTQTVGPPSVTSSPTIESTPFTPFSATASPLSKVPQNSPVLEPTSSSPEHAEEKSTLKAVSNFPVSASPSLASTSTPPIPIPAPRPSLFSSTPEFSTPESGLSTHPPPSGCNTGTGASSFPAFASTSGFGSKSAGGASFSAFAGSGTSPSPFASVKGLAISKKPADDSEDLTSHKAKEPEETKRVYTEQEVVTGEEEDETVHSVKCKLYAMNNEAWVERGSGLLKLNLFRNNDRHDARLIMRADATHRLLLNATLFSKFSIEVFQEKYVRFTIIEGTEPVSFMLRMSGSSSASTLVQKVVQQVELL